MVGNHVISLCNNLSNISTTFMHLTLFNVIFKNLIKLLSVLCHNLCGTVLLCRCVLSLVYGTGGGSAFITKPGGGLVSEYSRLFSTK